jgi:hypothetical protein
VIYLNLQQTAKIEIIRFYCNVTMKRSTVKTLTLKNAVALRTPAGVAEIGRNAGANFGHGANLLC